MKIRNTALITLVCTTFLFSACDNEIELNAPYKEIGVIYGLINPDDDTLSVRIQKAFLGKGNANDMAQITDSVYYGDILDVQMQRIQNGTVTSTFPLVRYIGTDKEDGVFPSSPNILYRSNGENIFRDSDYRIVVKNTQSGHIFSATTPIVDSMKIVRPTRQASSLIQFSNEDFTYNVEYLSGKNGKVFTLTLRFWYFEEVTGSGVPGVNKYLDWNFPNKILEDPTNVETITVPIKGEDFYEFLGENIPVNPSVFRIAGGIDFIFMSGAEFLANYVAISQSTTSVLTTAPYYSNVVGGTGIFSSRYIQTIPNKQLDPPSKALLLTSPYTSDLGFQ